MDDWRWATVLSAEPEADRGRLLRLSVPGGLRHRPGQHAVVRLVAPDGYTAQRSYSVASAPDGSDAFELMVERLDDGEVSPYLHDVVRPGDELQVRGPIGGWFAWDGTSPALLVGGGAGVVPLVSMLRHGRNVGTEHLLRVVVSVRTPKDLYFRRELVGPGVTIAYTRVAPAGSARPVGRIGPEDLVPSITPGAVVRVCGSNLFATAMTAHLERLGVDPSRIRVERFGPS